ncbi:MAG: hypothetical protein IMZ59_05740 [Actinobacteria bacterium]|nr:hypothetical protein [Actinomycetota bacterium]
MPDIFGILYIGLKRRRLGQGYSELYNVKIDGWDIKDDACMENFLEFKDEKPEIIAHKYIEDMTEKYRDYNTRPSYLGCSSVTEIGIKELFGGEII